MHRSFSLREYLFRRDTIFVPTSRFSKQCTSQLFPFLRHRSRYRLQKMARPWNEAAADCQTRGAKLVQLRTPGEHEFVVSLARANGLPLHQLLFIGLFKDDQNTWLWHGSNQTVTYAEPMDWATTATAVGEYGALNLETLDFTKVNGSSALPYVCECHMI